MWTTAPSQYLRARAAKLAERVPSLRSLAEPIAEGIAVPGMESLLPALVDEVVPLISFFPDSTTVIVVGPDRVRARAESLRLTNQEFLAAAWQSVGDGGDIPIDLSMSDFVDFDQFRADVARREYFTMSALDSGQEARIASASIPSFVGDPDGAVAYTGERLTSGGVVVIGNGGAEYDVRGYVTALDLETGKLRWRWHVVPRDPAKGPQERPEMEAALKTWDPNSRWDIGGGGTPWDAINYDAETGLVIIGTGNGGPYATSKRSPSGGDNLYLGSVVALDPKTGAMKWHYQETPGDNWDFTSTAPMILTHMKVDGEDRPVILHAPKNGFLYVIDRRSGKLLRANPIARINWAKGIDRTTGRPILDPAAADYTQGPRIVFPGTPGARNWFPAAYSPKTGLYYGAVLDMGNLIFMTPGQKPLKARALNNDAALIFTTDVADALATLPPPMAAEIKALPAFAEAVRQPATTEMRAIDPLTGKTVWSAPLAGWQDRSGVLVTDSGITPAQVDMVREAGVRLIVA